MLGKRRERPAQKAEEREVRELKAQVARIPEIVEEQVRDKVGAMITAIMPTLLEGLQAWIAGGQQGPPPIPRGYQSQASGAARVVWAASFV